MYRDGHGGARRSTSGADRISSSSSGSCIEVARLATTARTWDELLETVVDGTRDALHADVTSLYLLDRDGAYLTLAATNGLDRYQIGRARVPFGEGVTGRVAATPRAARDRRRPVRPALPVGPRHRPAPVHRLDAQRAAVAGTTRSSASSTSRRSASATSPTATSPSSGRSPTSWPGSSRRAASRREAEARLEQLRQIDEARSELIALVTHELRTPLAVVRAYTELLGDDPPLEGRESRDPDRRAQRAGLARRGDGPGRAARPPRRLDPRVRPDRPGRGRRRSTPTDVEATIAEVVGSIGPIVRQHHLEVRPGVRLHALADPPRLRQILEHLIENAVKYAPPRDDDHDRPAAGRGLRPDRRHATRAPASPTEWRERIFEPYARRETHTARGSGIGLYAAKRLGESMGARLWVEPAEPTGARFVVALPGRRGRRRREVA